MKIHHYIGILIFNAIVLNGCSTLVNSNQYMMITAPDKIYQPAEDNALIIFQRDDSHLADKSSVIIWDVTNSASPVFVALLNPTMKAAYFTTPGEHIFINALDNSRAIMKAVVNAHKTYFVMLEKSTLQPGIEFVPIRKGQENPISPTGISESLPNISDWIYKQQADRIASKDAIHMLRIWDVMPARERNSLTLHPEDGR